MRALVSHESFARSTRHKQYLLLEVFVGKILFVEAVRSRRDPSHLNIILWYSAVSGSSNNEKTTDRLPVLDEFNPSRDEITSSLTKKLD